MNYYVTLFLVGVLTLLGFSSGAHAQNINEPIISEVAKNDVSSDITVHTYAFHPGAISATNDLDEQPATAVSAAVQDIIDFFLGLPGVTRCTFDRATQTFTILSSPNSNFDAEVTNYNQTH